MAAAPDELMAARVRVPRQVVYRSFPGETVVLNLDTGQYHGLNPTAARMLEQLESSDNVAEALAALTSEFEVPVAEIERDLRELCAALLDRRLIELEPAES
jgi:hypothetical protein